MLKIGGLLILAPARRCNRAAVLAAVALLPLLKKIISGHHTAHDVGAGEQISLDVRLPPIGTPGSYSAVFDVVVEGLAWFADRGPQG